MIVLSAIAIYTAAWLILFSTFLQAILLNYQNNQLKQHHAKAVIGIFPPLQTMESRQTFGWRGKVAIRWVIAGFVMLMLAYFGSKFVIEFILS